MALRSLYFALTIFLSSAVLSDVAVDGDRLDDPVLEARARALMKSIRCLVCQNQSIEDSNAVIAQKIRKRVRAEIANGRSDDQIEQGLVADYGDWVMLAPPLDYRTIFLWGSPFILVAGGLALIWRRRKTAQQLGQAPLSKAEEADLDRLLKGDDPQ